MSYQLTETDITHIALGASFLGSGGGGDTKVGEIITKKAINDGINMEIISLAELPDEALVVAVGMIGAPTIFAEKLSAKEEGKIAIQKMEEVLAEQITYIMPYEMGGMNGLYGLYLALASQKIVVDADCMGRAFPEIHMVTPNIYGVFNRCIAVLASAQKCQVLFADNLQDLEAQARQKTIEMGGIAVLVYLPMKGRDVREYCVPASLAVARKIGSCLSRNNNSSDLVSFLNKALADTSYGPAKVIITGKVSDLHRNFEHGFNTGWLIIQDADGQQKIRIDFQNENLRVVNLLTAMIIALVPEIITLIDNNAKPLACENLRVGLEVTVITMQVPAILRSQQAIDIIRPKFLRQSDE